MGSSGREASCQEMLELVAALSGVSVEALLGPGRARALSRVRSAAMYLLRTEAGLSAREVARVVGRTPATVFDLSRLVARGERASDLVAAVRAELSACGADRSAAIIPGWKPRPVPGLSAHRQAAGLTQPELAAQAGITRETLSRIEHGRATRPDIADKLLAVVELASHAPRPRSGRWHRLPGLAPWRSAADLTQQELAARAGVARETLSRIEAGRPARWRVIESLARALLVMPSMLTGNEELDPIDEPARRCMECGALRPIRAFISIRGRPGYYSRCRLCRNARARTRYWSSAEILAAERERARRNQRLRKGCLRSVDGLS